MVRFRQAARSCRPAASGLGTSPVYPATFPKTAVPPGAAVFVFIHREGTLTRARDGPVPPSGPVLSPRCVGARNKSRLSRHFSKDRRSPGSGGFCFHPREGTLTRARSAGTAKWIGAPRIGVELYASWVDSEEFMNPAISASFDFPDFLARFEKAASHHGFVGEDVAETPVGPVRIWSNPREPNTKPRGFISAGIHGDEPSGPRALLAFLENNPLPSHRSWVLAPALNPTGLVAGTRENVRGIDLNRDFLIRRSAEVRGILKWWEGQRLPCVFHISLHEDWEATGLYLYTLSTSDHPTFARDLAEQLGKVVSLQANGPIDDHPLSAPGLILHDPEPDEPEGWPEAIWLVKRAPAASYTLEAPGAFSPTDRVRALHQALTLTLALDAKGGGAVRNHEC